MVFIYWLVCVLFLFFLDVNPVPVAKREYRAIKIITNLCVQAK